MGSDTGVFSAGPGGESQPLLHSTKKSGEGPSPRAVPTHQASGPLFNISSGIRQGQHGRSQSPPTQPLSLWNMLLLLIKMVRSGAELRVYCSRAGEMAQLCRGLSAPPEVLGWIPSSHRILILAYKPVKSTFLRQVFFSIALAILELTM